MSPETSESCPGGGDQLDKPPCGTMGAESDPITLNRETAYTGDIGRRRRQFCLEYTSFKKTMLAQGDKMLREIVASQGESISCAKGCAKCCSLYVTATFQEAECITGFLYQHEATLQHFITAYRIWERKIGLFDHRRLDQEIARSLAGDLSDSEKEQLGLRVYDYNRRRVSCPFLIDNACAIYEVRPFVCAGVVAVTPPEMCAFHVPGVSRARHRKIDFDLRQEMPYFIQSRAPVVFGCMPVLVHRILEQGYSFLGSIEGLEQLRQKKPATSG